MKLYELDRTVLSLQNGPTQFLQGLTSNTVDKPQNAFLNIHGRIIVTFDQVRIGDDEIWAVIGRQYDKPLMAHIDKYAKLSGLNMKTLDKCVYFDLDGSGELDDGQVAIPQKTGRIVISDGPLKSNVPEEEFTLFRVKNRIPFQGIDYTDEFILNVGAQDFVSFSKGCFLGQEPVSKVHNRSRPTWQLVVKYEDDCDEESKKRMTSRITDPDTNKTIGFIFIKNGQ